MKSVHIRSRAAVLLLACLFAGIAARGFATEELRVVATTPWTAAFALAAGVENVRVLAPYEMQHPPEYELRASDVVRVQIDELTQAAPAVVVDVWHNESAGPLRETVPGAIFVSLINFPGRDGTRTLMDVLQHKRSALTEAVEGL